LWLCTLIKKGEIAQGKKYLFKLQLRIFFMPGNYLLHYLCRNKLNSNAPANCTIYRLPGFALPYYWAFGKNRVVFSHFFCQRLYLFYYLCHYFKRHTGINNQWHFVLHQHLIEFKGEEKMIDRFFQYYQQDIAGYFPSFQKNMLLQNLNFAVLRDLVIANVFSAKLTEKGDAEVNINYTLEKYRDYKVGKFIFQREKEFLLSKGIKRIVYRQVTNKNHLYFLKKMGFLPEQAGNETFWVKAI